MNPLDEPLSRSEHMFVPTRPTIVKYALIGSAIIILFKIVSFSIGSSFYGILRENIVLTALISLLTFITYILIMVFGLKEYKMLSGGYVSLGKGMLVTYVSTLIMATLGLTISVIYLCFINPESISNMFDGIFGERTMSASEVKVYRNIALGYTISFFIIGCIGRAVLSLIIAAIMKKDYSYRSV